MSGPMSGQNDSTDDAILGAYLDRELPEKDAERLAARLAADPALARRLEEMRSANLAVRHAFEAADELPLPRAVLDLLQNSDVERPAQEPGRRLLEFPKRARRRYLQAPAALAASLALVVGFLLGDLVRRPAGVDADTSAMYAGDISPGSELHQLLENGLSNEPQELASGAQGQLLLTFRDEEGDYCRQVQLSGEAVAAQALACRRGDAWQMEAISFDDPGPPGGDYRPAASRSSAALDAAVDAAIGTNEPLEAEEETAVISSGWKKSGE